MALINNQNWTTISGIAQLFGKHKSGVRENALRGCFEVYTIPYTGIMMINIISAKKFYDRQNTKNI